MKRKRKRAYSKSPSQKDGSTPKLARKSASECAKDNFHIIVVALICLIFAVRMGALQPDFEFQKASEQMLCMDGCSCTSGLADVVAAGNTLMLRAPHLANASAHAIFYGSGEARKLALSYAEQEIAITNLAVNGKLLCKKCNSSEDYPISGDDGKLEVYFDSSPKPGAARQGTRNATGQVFFDNSSEYTINAQVYATVDGGWKATPNARMPSSFYGVDAPYHMHKVLLLGEYLPRTWWPYSFYTYVSVVPPALLHIAGATHQYAYKLYEIALFFVPIIIFYLFSGKTGEWRRPVFLFASLLYLFIPSNGLPIGSGVDLFMYGMTAHTLATYLSMFFIYFAYEFLAERKNPSFLPAVLLFFLSVQSNQRILFAMLPAFAVLAGVCLATSRFRRVALLAIACAASVAWTLAPFIIVPQDASVDGGASVANIAAGYAVVGGAGANADAPGSLLALFQIGYVALPVFFVIGAFVAYRKGFFAPLLLACIGLAVYIIGASPEVNRWFPFVDGIRLFPSFFIPAFFVAGVGLAGAYYFVRRKAEDARLRLGYDRITFAGSYMLIVLVPLAIVLFVAADAAIRQYAPLGDTLAVANEYSSLQKAYEMIGEERAVFLGRGEVSQHLIYESKAGSTLIVYDFGDGESIAGMMKRMKIRYLFFGNYEMLPSEPEEKVWGKYSALKSDLRFQEIEYGGSVPLFALKGAGGGGVLERSGVLLKEQAILPDRAKFSGTCLFEGCEIRVHTYAQNPSCSGFPGCNISYDGSGAMVIRGMAPGEFEAYVEPALPGYLPYLALACALLIAVCAYSLRSSFFS